MPNARILIVEDEAITSMDMQAELERLGYQVVGAAFDGEEALTIAEARQPELVLMDINLRGKLDGINTALKLKDQYSMPVIFVTAMIDEAAIQRAKLCEPHGYVIKPIRQGDLQIAIEHALYNHEIEAKLRQSEAHFRELFETSLDGIVSTDLTGTIIDCNAAFSGLVGYSPDELIGLGMAALTPHEYILRETQVMERAAHAREFLDEYIKEYLHKDGSRIPVSLRIWLRRDSESRPVGYWGIVRDITRLREAERQIQRQADYAQSLVTLTALLSNQFNLPDLLQTICKEIAQIMEVEVSLISLVDPESDTLHIVHHFGPPMIEAASLQPCPLEYHQKFLASGEAYRFFYDVQETQVQNPYYALLAKLDVRSTMTLKLSCESKPIGTLDLATIGGCRHFSNDELHFLLTVANQAAIAIDRARLYQQAQNRADELEELGRLSTNLRPAVTPHEMLPVLLNEGMKLAGADCGIIYLLGDAGNPIDQFELESTDAPAGEWFLPGGTLWARALVNEAVLSLAKSPSLTEEAADSIEIQDPILSIILLSLRSANTLAAIMALGSTRPKKIEPRILRVLASLTETGGNALHRSGLMEMLEKRASDRSSELSTLYDISVFINSPFDIKTKLDGALKKALASVGADCGIIFRYDADTRRLLLETQQKLPPEMAASVDELSLEVELKEWLEKSTIPWLATRREGQSSPFDFLGAFDFQTLINLPVRFENQTLGMVCVLWKNQVDLSPENIALLIAVTTRIGSAIQNETLRLKAEAAVLLEERQRLARELHDSVTQSLYSQTLLAEAASDMLAQGDLSSLERCLADLGENSLQALKEMRLLLFQLRPMLAGGQDLANALQNRLEAVERRSGIRTLMEVKGAATLPQKVHDELYRVAIEALNNCLKHSRATAVTVGLNLSANEVQLRIEDNGKGFNVDEIRSAGMGLTSMQERVKQLGGTLKFESTPGQGTKVTAAVKFNGE